MVIPFEDCDPVGVGLLARDSPPGVDVVNRLAREHLGERWDSEVTVRDREAERNVSTTLAELDSLSFEADSVSLQNYEFPTDPAVEVTVTVTDGDRDGPGPEPYLRLYVVEERVYGERAYVDGLVDGVAGLVEALPVEFLYLTPQGPLVDQLPRDIRTDPTAAVLADGAFLTGLGPDLAGGVDRETLCSLPVAEVRTLDDGSVLLRGWATMREYDVEELAAAREHLGLDPYSAPAMANSFDGALL